MALPKSFDLERRKIGVPYDPREVIMLLRTTVIIRTFIQKHTTTERVTALEGVHLSQMSGDFYLRVTIFFDPSGGFIGRANNVHSSVLRYAS